MKYFSRRSRGHVQIYLGAFFLIGAVCGSASAQGGATTPDEQPHVISLMHFVHATNTLDTTLAFYHDVFGLEIPAPKDMSGPEHGALHNRPGASLRASTPKFPNVAIEITQWSHVDRKPGRALPTDPGTVELILPVRNFDEVVANLRKHNAPILSRSGAPVEVTTSKGATREVVARDPDGYLVRVIEVPSSEATVPGIIQPGVAMGIAVKDMGAIAKFYHDTLGFNVMGSMEFTHDKSIADLVGTSENSEYRHMWANFPGSSDTRIEFYEWKGITRTPFHLRVPDPGAPALVMRVNDIDGMLKNLNAQGIRAESADGKPIWFSPTVSDIFVTDINGLNLELYQIVPKQK